MADISIENIIAYAQIANVLELEKIAEKLPEFKYNPNEFSGLTLKLDDPKSAILLLPSGKAICTGTKKIEDAEIAIKKSIDKIKDIIGVKLKKKFNVEIQNIIASTDLKKELNLSSISTSLLLENVDFEPRQFPGLIYRMDDIGALFILFGSGKIVCTGTNNIKDATNAIKIMEEKLSSIGF